MERRGGGMSAPSVSGLLVTSDDKDSLPLPFLVREHVKRWP